MISSDICASTHTFPGNSERVYLTMHGESAAMLLMETGLVSFLHLLSSFSEHFVSVSMSHLMGPSDRDGWHPAFNITYVMIDP